VGDDGHAAAFQLVGVPFEEDFGAELHAGGRGGALRLGGARLAAGGQQEEQATQREAERSVGEVARGQGVGAMKGQAKQIAEMGGGPVGPVFLPFL